MLLAALLAFAPQAFDPATLAVPAVRLAPLQADLQATGDMGVERERQAEIEEEDLEAMGIFGTLFDPTILQDVRGAFALELDQPEIGRVPLDLLAWSVEEDGGPAFMFLNQKRQLEWWRCDRNLEVLDRHVFEDIRLPKPGSLHKGPVKTLDVVPLGLGRWWISRGRDYPTSRLSELSPKLFDGATGEIVDLDPVLAEVPAIVDKGGPEKFYLSEVLGDGLGGAIARFGVPRPGFLVGLRPALRLAEDGPTLALWTFELKSGREHPWFNEPLIEPDSHGAEAWLLGLGGRRLGLVRWGATGPSFEALDTRDFIPGATVQSIDRLDRDHVVVRTGTDAWFGDPVAAMILDLRSGESVPEFGGREAGSFIKGVEGELQFDGHRWTRRQRELWRHDADGNVVERYASPHLEANVEDLYETQPLGDGRWANYDADTNVVHLWDASGQLLGHEPGPDGEMARYGTRVFTDPEGRLWYGSQAYSGEAEIPSKGPVGTLPFGRYLAIDPEGQRLWSWKRADESTYNNPKALLELFALDDAGTSVADSVAVIDVEGKVVDVSFEEGGTAWVWLETRALAFDSEGELLREVGIAGYRPESGAGLRVGAMSVCRKESMGLFDFRDLWCVIDLSTPGEPRRAGIDDLVLIGWEPFALEPMGVVLTTSSHYAFSAREADPLFARRSFVGRKWQPLSD